MTAIAGASAATAMNSGPGSTGTAEAFDRYAPAHDLAFTINDKPVRLSIDPLRHPLDVLREACG